MTSKPETNNWRGAPVSPHGDQNFQSIPGSHTRMLPYDPERRACCGRCSAVPRYFDIKFRWETPTGLVNDPPPPEFTDNLIDLPEEFPYMTPQWNERYAFDYIGLRREPPFYRLGAGQTTNGTSPMPYPAEMLRCFWRSKLFTSGDTLWELHWYLFYGDWVNDSALGGDVPANVLTLPYVEFDSECFSAGTEFDQPPTYRGWVLMLIRRRLSLLLPGQPPADIRPGFPQPTDPGASVITKYSWYGAWRLPAPQSVEDAKPMFDALSPTDWEIFHNPLQFPQHTLRLSPLFP